MASSSSAPNGANAGAASIITALGTAFKTQTGEPLSGEKIAQLLLQNMAQLGELAKQGKLNQQQIMQVRNPSLCCVHSKLTACMPLAEGVCGQTQSQSGASCAVSKLRSQDESTLAVIRSYFPSCLYSTGAQDNLKSVPRSKPYGGWVSHQRNSSSRYRDRPAAMADGPTRQAKFDSGYSSGEDSWYVSKLLSLVADMLKDCGMSRNSGADCEDRRRFDVIHVRGYKGTSEEHSWRPEYAKDDTRSGREHRS